jgi:tetratricopeptide (TPR) repeat protein
VAIFGNLFGQIFGDSAAELEAQGDYYAGVSNWRRAAEEYRRALQRTNKTSIGYRRLAAKFDEARINSFDALVEEIHSHIDVREFTYASEQLAVARGHAETEAQREKLAECERRLRGFGRAPLEAPPPAAAAESGRGSDAAGRFPEAPARAAGGTGSRQVESPPAARVEPAGPRTEPPGPRGVPPIRPSARFDPEPRAAQHRDPSPEQAFQKALARMAPEQVALRQKLGPEYRDAVLAMVHGETARAVELFRQSLETHPDEPIVLRDLAAALAAAGRAREAQSVHLRLAERDPADWQPYYEIALLQWNDGLRERATATIAEGLELHPRSGYLMAQWGVFLYKLGDKRGALDRFYQALQLDSFDDAGLYHAIANLHLELGDGEKARRGYLKALELNPQSIGTMLDYAEFLIEQKNDARAALAILETTFRTLRSLSGQKLHHAYRSYLSSKAHLLLGEREMALLAVTRALEENDQAWLEDTLESQRQAVLAV